MKIIPIRSSLGSGSPILEFRRHKQCLDLDVAASQDSSWRIDQERRVCIQVCNRKWHLVRRPVAPLSRWEVTHLLKCYIIPILLGLSVACSVCFWKFLKSQLMSQSFLMRSEIHFLLCIRDVGFEFLTSYWPGDPWVPESSLYLFSFRIIWIQQGVEGGGGGGTGGVSFAP